MTVCRCWRIRLKSVCRGQIQVHPVCFLLCGWLQFVGPAMLPPVLHLSNPLGFPQSLAVFCKGVFGSDLRRFGAFFCKSHLLVDSSPSSAPARCPAHWAGFESLPRWTLCYFHGWHALAADNATTTLAQTWMPCERLSNDQCGLTPPVR